jgi:hypothetical protein
VPRPVTASHDATLRRALLDPEAPEREERWVRWS